MRSALAWAFGVGLCSCGNADKADQRERVADRQADSSVPSSEVEAPAADEERTPGPGSVYVLRARFVDVIDPDGTIRQVLSPDQLRGLAVQGDGSALVWSDHRIYGVGSTLAVVGDIPDGVVLRAVARGKDDQLFVLDIDRIGWSANGAWNWKSAESILPAQAERRAMLHDLASDAAGNVWFAASGSVGRHIGDNEWKLSPLGTDQDCTALSPRLDAPAGVWGLRVSGPLLLEDRHLVKAGASGKVQEVCKLSDDGHFGTNGRWGTLRAGRALTVDPCTPVTEPASTLLEAMADAPWTLDASGRPWVTATDGIWTVVHGEWVKAVDTEGGSAIGVYGTGPSKVPALALTSPYSPPGSRASVMGGSSPGADTIVATMAPGFRRCYSQGLADDPAMRGTVRVTARVGPSGKVDSAVAGGGGGLSEKVKDCCVAVVNSKTFNPPEGGGATVIIPISFVPQ